MLLLGVSLSAPACLLAAYAPSDTVLFAARLLGGVSAGMAYPTTLALITALWSGQPRTRSIAVWSATGGAIASLGPLIAGALLEHFWWGSVFLVTLPLAAVALVMAVVLVPAHVNEETPRGTGDPARRDHDGLDRAAVGEARGDARRAVHALVGYVFCFLGFLTMLLLWKEGIPYWKVGLGYALVGIGVGFAGTPASHSLTGSVPVQRGGMASGTADLHMSASGSKSSSPHHGNRSGNGRPKTTPKYRASVFERCLTKPRRFVPVAVKGRRTSYSPSPSSFHSIAARTSRRSRCK